jgi:hypothetical protein
MEPYSASSNNLTVIADKTLFSNPGLKFPVDYMTIFSPVNRAEIFSPASFNWAGISARVETHPRLKFLSCNRLLCFNRILSLPPPQASLGLLQRERESERKENRGKADGKAARE